MALAQHQIDQRAAPVEEEDELLSIQLRSVYLTATHVTGLEAETTNSYSWTVAGARS